MSKVRIKQLHIEGFRSLKNVTWEPGDLNVLIGANGTGKSNLLRLLELMTVAAKGGVGRYIQSLGGMDAIVWDGRAEGISFKVVTEENSPAPSTYEEESSLVPHTYELVLSRLGETSAYFVGLESLTGVFGDSRELVVLIQREPHQALLKEGFSDTPREVDPKAINLEETILSSVSSAILGFEDISDFQLALSYITTHQDILVHRNADLRKPVVARIEHQVDADGQNLISVLHTLYTTDRGFERSIDDAMRAAFGEDYEKLVFPPAADQRVQLRLRWKSLRREQSAADLSDGTLRFLFLLTVLRSPDPPPLIAIDEPEAGLHPAMLPIIAEFAVEAATRTQVVLTTHSPQMLDAFGDARPTVTVTKWRDGETILENLRGINSTTGCASTLSARCSSRASWSR